MSKLVRKETTVYGTSYAVGPQKLHLYFGVFEFGRAVHLCWRQDKSVGFNYYHA